jgi:hypothetical protein
VCVCVCVCCRAGNPNAFATPDNFADCVPYLNQTLAHYGYPAQINLPTTTDQHAVRHRERGRERGSGAGGLTRELETPLPSNQRTMVQRRATRNSTCGPGPTPHQHRECTFTLGPRLRCILLTGSGGAGGHVQHSVRDVATATTRPRLPYQPGGHLGAPPYPCGV